ncbi:MAG TPA: hypothetical protein VFS34_10460 [Thermoanaerobaculia bacterium]|nr:hypothetical protein [Thermoanaerobaculia bacterium]
MTASAAALPVRVTVGQPFRVTLVLDAPPRSAVSLVNPPSTPELSRLAVSPWTARREGAAGWRLERVETWASFVPGSSPSLRWRYAIRAAGSPAASGELATPPVAVASVLPKGGASPEAAPLRAPVTRPYVPWQIPAALLLAAAVAALFAIFFRRRRAAPSRVRNADEIFDGELDLLESSLARSVPEDTFYDWLAEITRWYLEQKLAFPATRLTSAEIASRLRATEAPGSADDAGNVFSVCDGIRFARREHRRDLAQEAIAAARRAAAAIRAAEHPEPERRSA